jgi:hypothetical protein
MIIRRILSAGAACAIAAAAVSVAHAQDMRPERAPLEGFYFQSENFGHATWVATEFAFDNQIVKNAPYSAEAVSESIQTLADGNRIVRTSSSKIYRDTQGRTRREQTIRSIGPWAASAAPGRVVIINDPVAGTTLVVNPDERSARRLPATPMVFSRSGGSGANVVVSGGAAGGSSVNVRSGDPVTVRKIEVPDSDVEVVVASPGTPVAVAGSGVAFGRAIGEGSGSFEVVDPANRKTESLGKRAFDGVEAEGTRTTITIDAGTIGNERPIEIVSERWFAPSLQTVVYTRHYDPRFGETTFKLTNIDRSEPDATLFEAPTGYTVTTTPGFEQRFYKQKLEKQYVETKARKKP